MVLAIVGSRQHYLDQDKSTLDAQNIIARTILDLNPDKVVSGGADGVDTLAEKIAVEWFRIPFEKFEPTVRRWWGVGGFKERNMKVAETCDALLRVATKSTKTYGSGWTADYAEKLGKRVIREEVGL